MTIFSVRSDATVEVTNVSTSASLPHCDYLNYKGYFSIVPLLHILVREHQFFWTTMEDFFRENIWLTTLAPDVLPGSQKESPFVFFGGKAFPLKKNLIRPYSGKWLDGLLLAV